jgi:hypothetical protein
MTGLRRLTVEFTGDGIRLRTLYRTSTGANPGTKKRRREVEALAREGLRHALAALDRGETEMIGTAGFTTREDTLALEASPFLPSASNNVKQRKGA